MKIHNRATKIITVCVVSLFLFTVMTNPALAAWRDRSKELPGKSEDELIKSAVVILGVLVGIGLIAYVAKKNSAEDETAEILQKRLAQLPPVQVLPVFDANGKDKSIGLEFKMDLF